jgi:hypothetical protein
VRCQLLFCLVRNKNFKVYMINMDLRQRLFTSQETNLVAFDLDLSHIIVFALFDIESEADCYWDFCR